MNNKKPIKNTQDKARKALFCLVIFWTIASILAFVSFGWLIVEKTNDSKLSTVKASAATDKYGTFNPLNGEYYVTPLSLAGLSWTCTRVSDGVSTMASIDTALTFSFSYDNENAVDTGYVEIDYYVNRGTTEQSTGAISMQSSSVGTIGTDNIQMFYVPTAMSSTPTKDFYPYQFKCARRTSMTIGGVVYPSAVACIFTFINNNGDLFPSNYVFYLVPKPNAYTSFTYANSPYAGRINTVQLTEVLKTISLYDAEASGSSNYLKGYNAGVQVGEANGYQNGYNAGVAESNEYTFTGLLTAVFDVPINAIVGLFDFDLLGFNMLTFFGSILTLAVIIFVVKLFV